MRTTSYILISLTIVGFTAGFGIKDVVRSLGNAFEIAGDAIDGAAAAVNDAFNNALVKSLEGVSRGCTVAPRDTDDCPPEITYWLYTKDNRDGVQIDQNNPGSAGFVDKQYKFLIHGYQNDHTSLMITALMNAYLDYGEYNVIVVDWGHFVKPGCYLQGRNSINAVAGCITTFLRNAVGEDKLNQVHILGHSLGAHMASRVSGHFDNPQVSRLTRFDPAMPLFIEGTTDKGKADFRDTYHSNSDVLGQSGSQGDIDIYLNSDQFQPGCQCDLACSHMRSVLYFAESIPNGMKGFYCSFWDHFVNGKCERPTQDTLMEVGDHADTNLRGSFKVFGKPTSPFLYSEDNYLDEDKFNDFKQVGHGECTQEVIGSIGDKMKEFLLENQVSKYFKDTM